MNKLIIVITGICLLCFCAGKLFFEDGCDFVGDDCIGMVLKVNVTSVLNFINMNIIIIKIYVSYIKNSNQRFYLKIVQLITLILISLFLFYSVIMLLFIFS
jgi:hypothetical protein